jgi:PPOX class probable F420-dependent enzyme
MSSTGVPKTHEDILQSTALAFVSTLGPKGEPRTSPVWFGWDGNVLRFSHMKARQKYRNLKRDPRIAVTVVDPATPYRYIEMRGTVTIEDDPTKAYADAMAKKYTGNDHYEGDQPGDERVIISLKPERVHTMG